MRLVVFAYHDLGCACLEALVREGHEVAMVLTHRDDPLEKPWFGSVTDTALALGIPVRHPRNVNRAHWFDLIRHADPDMILSFYYRRLLAPEITELPPRGALNLHGSLLPRYRGRCPLNWVLLHGEHQTGVTLHHMTETPDAGDIVAQQSIAITERDTAPTLHRRLVAAAESLLCRTLPSLEQGNAPRRPQDPAQASHFGRRRPADGRIDWSRPAESIHNLVRAVTHPWPGAFTTLGGRKLFVWESAWHGEAAGGPPGQVLAEPGLQVATGGGHLCILRGQLEGHAVSGGADLVGSNVVRPGALLGTTEVTSCAS